MVKGIKRFFPVLCCIVILISCMVVPASAVSPGVYPYDAGTKIVPVVGANLYYVPVTEFGLGAENEIASSLRFADWAYNSADGYLGSGENVNMGPVAGSEQSGEHVVAHWVQTSQVSVDGNDTYRLKETLNIHKTPGYTDMYPISFIITLDDFGGVWNKAEINRLLYIVGQFQFVTMFDFYSISLDGELVHKRITNTGSSNGTQSVIFNSWLSSIENEFNLSSNSVYFITDFRCEVVLNTSHQPVVISRLAEPQGRMASVSQDGDSGMLLSVPPRTELIANPVFNLTSYRFLFLSGLRTGGGSSFMPDYGSSWTSWLASTVSGFFDGFHIGDFNLGYAIGIVCVVAFVIWILKLFAGG